MYVSYVTVRPDQLVRRDFAAMKNLLGVSEIISVVCKWGDSTGEV